MALIEFEPTPYCCTLILTLTLTFDLSTPKPRHVWDIPRSFPTPSLNNLSHSFLSYAADKQTDKQSVVSCNHRLVNAYEVIEGRCGVFAV